MKKSFARKTAVGLICLSLLSSGIAVPKASAASTLGDVNEDGIVSVADTVVLQKYINRIGSLSRNGLANADMNSDGRVNIFDLSILKNNISVPFSDTVKIHLSDSGITVENDSRNVVSVNGKIVTVSASGKYLVDGTMTEGQILVNIPDIVADAAAAEITLNNVSITNSTMPCIYSQSADKVKLTAIGTNTLTDTASAARIDTPGCIYSLSDMTITKNSTGTLNITSSFNNGIDCNEDLSLNGGTIVVNTDVDTLSDADAIKARETVSVDGADITIDSSADGIKSGKRNVEILSGSVTVKAGNDAIQASTSIDISGGTVIAGGDRGFRLDDAGLLNITGGNVLATATDYQITDSALSLATINMSGSTQNIMLLDFAAQQVKNQAITLKTGSQTAVEMTANKKFNYALVSSPNVALNNAYNLYVGGIQQGHTNGTAADFTMTSNGAEFTAIAAMGGSASTDDNAAASVVYSTNGVSVLNAAGNTVASPSNLSVSGSKVTITEPGIISVSGSSTAAQIVVDVDKTTYPTGVVELDLTGADLSNSSASPIYVKQIGDEVQIVAKSGTTNTISDGTSHSDTNTDGEVITAAIYAEDDLKIKGSGSLTVNGNTEDGIATKNDLKIYNGTIKVTAKDDGLRGGDSVTIGNDTATDFSTLNLTVNASAGDGVKANDMDTTSGKGFITVNGGTINVTSNSDAFHASQALNINGGELTIKTTGSASNTSDISAKGLKAGKTDSTTNTTVTGVININGGHIDADTTDDCVHANGNIYLNGGVLELNSGDDAVHSDADLTIGQGNNTFDDLTVIVEAGYEGMEATNITQNSGTVIVNTTDDGYNAAGGADGSGNTNPGGWGGGWNPGGSSGNNSITINGGFALVNATDGDHDGFDSNGSITINGGYAISNGTDAFDSDGTQTYSGGVFVKEEGSRGGMGGGMGGGSMTATVSGSVSASAGTRITICDGSGNVIVSFIADKSATTISAGCTGYTGATIYTGGELSGSTYFQTIDSTQLAAYGGTLVGGTAAGASSSNPTNPWG